MAQLNHYDIAGSFQRGQEFGNALRVQREGEQRRNRLAELAGQAYGAPSDQRQGFVQQAAAIDPDAGHALNQQLGYDDDRRNRTMVNMARMLTSAPEQARPALYQRMSAQFPAMGMKDFPPGYTPETRDLILGTAQSLLQAYSDNAADSTPSDIRSLQILRDNPELAELDRQRRQYSGMVPKMVETSQGIGWGTPGGGIQLAPLQGVAGSNGAGVQPGLYNTPNGQVRIPEALTPEQWQAVQADMAAGGASDAYQLPPRDVPPQAFGGGGGVAQPYQAPQRETIPAGYRARPDGSLEAIPGGPADPNVIANTSAARRPPSPAERRDASTRKTKYAQAQNVERGLDLIQQALQGLGGRFLDTGPIDQYAQRFTKAGQELEAAVGGMQNSLLALTRVPGIGAQSDLEARIAMLQYPSLDKAPEVNARTIENLRQFARDLKAAYDTAIAEDEEMMTAPVNAPREQGSDIDSLLDMYR